MTRDEQRAWLQLQANCGCATDPCEHTDAEPPDAVTAAAMRIVSEHGWFYDPPLSPETVLQMVEVAQLPPWHVRDDTGRVWRAVSTCSVCRGSQRVQGYECVRCNGTGTSTGDTALYRLVP